MSKKTPPKSPPKTPAKQKKSRTKKDHLSPQEIAAIFVSLIVTHIFVADTAHNQKNGTIGNILSFLTDPGEFTADMIYERKAAAKIGETKDAVWDSYTKRYITSKEYMKFSNPVICEYRKAMNTHGMKEEYKENTMLTFSAQKIRDV